MLFSGFPGRHLLTLPPGFRIARGAEKAVVAALETPVETPRVLVIPQWCVDPVDPHAAEESSSLDLEDLRGQTADGTARLCVSHNKSESSAYIGAGDLEAVVMDAAGSKGGSASLGGADARKPDVGAGELEGAVTDGAGSKEGWAGLRGANARKIDEDRDPRKIRNAMALLKSGAVSPVIVVDLWSAPALFLRHIEVHIFLFSTTLCVLGVNIN